MKAYFINMSLCKTMPLLIAFCFILSIPSLTYGQVTATETFDGTGQFPWKSTGAYRTSGFTTSGISFNLTGVLNTYRDANLSAAGFGANSSNGWVDSPISSNNRSQNVGAIHITTPSTSFKVNSFASWTSNAIPGNVYASGTVTFIGTKPDGTTVSATKTITPLNNTGTGWHQGINFTGTALENVQLIALSFLLPSNLSYFSIDDFNFTTSSATVLPVRLLSFTGKNVENYNLLEWQTAEETQNEGFEIERSTNATSFERIGFVKGAIESNDIKSYSFKDTQPLKNTSYYRLKQLDTNGKFSYSRTIAILTETSEKLLMLYPNPTSDMLTIKTNDGVLKEAQLLSTSGNLLAYKTAEPNDISFSLKELPVGTYFLLIAIDDYFVSKKIVKN